MSNPDSLKSFADMLKEEYGEGGSSFGNYMEQHNASGIRLDVVISGQPEEIKLSWSQAAKGIAWLISRGVYLSESVSEKQVTKSDDEKPQFYKEFEAVIEDDDFDVDIKYKYKDKYGLFKQDKILDANTFSNFYFDNKLSEQEYSIWRATNWDGTIDLNKVDFAFHEYLLNSSKFVQTGTNLFMNINFFLSGNIYQKLDELESRKDKIPENIYANMYRMLTEVKPSLVHLKDIKIPIHSNISDEFTVSRQLYGDVAELSVNLKEDFLNWATGRYLSEWKQLSESDRNKLVSVISNSADSEKAFASFIRKKVTSVRVSVEKLPKKVMLHDGHGR